MGGDCEQTAERAGGVKAFQDGERGHLVTLWIALLRL